MKDTRSILAAILVGMLCLAASASHGQETPKADAQSKPVLPPPVPYHLEFAFNEMQDGKKVNTRHYLMDLNVGNTDEMRIGIRVPIEELSKQGGDVQYINVGTNIWARLTEEQNILAVQVRAEISNFALPDEASHPGERPILRDLSIHGSTVVTLGKAVVIGSLDDPNSTHQFQLEVTVTKLN